MPLRHVVWVSVLHPKGLAEVVGDNSGVWGCFLKGWRSMDWLKKYNEGFFWGGGGFDPASEQGRQDRKSGIDIFSSDIPGNRLLAGLFLLALCIVFIAPVAALVALYLLWKTDWRAGVLYIATMAAELALLDSVWGAKRVGEAIDAIGVYWELSWLPKLLPNTVWWEHMLFAGAVIGLAVAVALPAIAGFRSFVCGLLCLPFGLCAGLAATPLVWSATWTLVPVLFPLAAIAFFTTVAAAAQRARGWGLLTAVIWGCVVAVAFGYWVYTCTPHEGYIAIYKHLYKEELVTLVSRTAEANFWIGSAIGFGAALIGGLPLIALFARKPITKVEAWNEKGYYELDSIPSSGESERTGRSK